MSKKGNTPPSDLKLFLQDFLQQSKCTGESSQGAHHVQNFGSSPDVAEEINEMTLKLILSHVQHQSVKSWSDTQDKFLVITHQEDESSDKINFLYALIACASQKGATKSLEEVLTIAVRYEELPSAGFLMNNLGVKLSERGSHEKSNECFNIAKRCFHRQQDNLGKAVVTLNQAVLHRALGDYKSAQSLSVTAASLCDNVWLGTTKDSHLPEKLLRRVFNMLQEFGEYETLCKTFKIFVEFDKFCGVSKPTSMVLTKQWMKLQLREGTGENVPAEEVKEFVLQLFALLDKPDAEVMNIDFIQTIIFVAKFHHDSGHNDEACHLLKKLRKVVHLNLGGESSLYGLLLYRIGCFKFACGLFDEALEALKLALEILSLHFGQGHHTIASCMDVMGSCFLLKSNTREAWRCLNEALERYRKLNPSHPVLGGILLKLSFFHIKEKKFQCALDTMQEALDVFISACGELSVVTATGYFQSAMVLLKDEAVCCLAEEKLIKAIDIFEKLGLKYPHAHVIACRSLLGVLQLSLRKSEEAGKCFLDIEQQLELKWDPWIKSRIFLFPSVSLLVSSLTAGLDRSFDLCAKVVSLVNLVQMKTGNERHKYLDVLVNCLQEQKIEEVHVRDFAGQDVCYMSHRLPETDRAVVLILSTDPKPISLKANEGLNSHSVHDALQSHARNESGVFLSSAKKKHFVLFLRFPRNIQDDANSLACSLHNCAKMLFLQLRSRKYFVEADEDFYRELTVPIHDMSSILGLIDCLPLLVAMELSELKEQCENIGCSNSWESPVRSVKPLLLICYSSFECSNQREAELVFGHLSHRLEENLAVKKGYGVISPMHNAAFLVVTNLKKSSVSVVVENKFVVVKCCSSNESDLESVCSLIQNALQNPVQSLCDVIGLNIKQSSWFSYNDIATSKMQFSVEDFLPPPPVPSEVFSPVLALETGDLVPCTVSRDPESDIKKQPTVDVVKDEVSIFLKLTTKGLY